MIELSPKDSLSFKGILKTVPFLVSPITLMLKLSVGPKIEADPPIKPVP